MKVDLAFLCDHAVTGDKIHAHGVGVDTILARSAPVRHPQLWLVLQVRCPGRVGEKRLEMNLVEPGGTVMMRQAGTLNFTPHPQGRFSVARFAVGYYSLELKTFGEYAFEVLVEGEPAIRLPFELMQVGG